MSKTIHRLPLRQLRANPSNPRTITQAKLDKLVQSLRQFPQMLELRPIVVESLENPVVLGGNMRLRALQQLGVKEVPVLEAADLTAQQRDEFVIKDNVGFGEWDWDALANDWDPVELEEWGLDIPELPALTGPVEDDFYEVPAVINTEIVLGDLIEIGEHRIVCGDSTDSEHISKLMNGAKAEISFTSPPYNAGKTATELKSGKSSKYISDEDNKTSEEYLEFLVDFTNNSLLFSEYSFVNIQSISGNKLALIEYLNAMKSVYADSIIWNKLTAQPAMAENVLNSQFEYIHVFSQKANRAIGTKRFRGTLSNVLDISKQTRNEVKEHNATFPVQLANFFVSNFCESSVLDLFLGSGTTMVAAHQLGRKCYGMELEPRYCQVIIERMIKLDASLEIKINGKKYNNVKN